MDRQEISVIIADMRMPVETGVDLLAWACEHHPDAIRILLTGYADMESTVAAINRGRAWYYLRKPWDNHEMRTLVQRALEYRAKEMELRRTFKGTIRSLVVALEANHPYTCGHSTRVTSYTSFLAGAIDLPHLERERIVLAAQLHDIGKIGVDKHYLDKNGALSTEEWVNVKQHVVIGGHILEETGFLENVLPYVVTHHERLDGRGYPRGLTAEDIPLGGRIIALADSFDAMTSDRAYRKAMSLDAAVAELRKGRGLQFDPDLADLFCEAVESGRMPLPVSRLLA
jgi:putative nucleotidyltransferase with HDIG domain